MVRALSALAQETRLEVLRLLVQAGPAGQPAGEIARQLGVPAPTLSFHLRAMLHAELVTSRRSGRSLIYAANFDALSQVVGYLTKNCCAAGRRPSDARARGGAPRRAAR